MFSFFIYDSYLCISMHIYTRTTLYMNYSLLFYIYTKHIALSLYRLIRLKLLRYSLFFFFNKYIYVFLCVKIMNEMLFFII